MEYWVLNSSMVVSFADYQFYYEFLSFLGHTHTCFHTMSHRNGYTAIRVKDFLGCFFFSFHENQSSMKWFSTHFPHYISVFLFIFSFWCYYIIRIGAHIQQTTIIFKQNSKFITINHCGFSEIYGNFQLKCKIDLNISDVIDSVGLYAMDLNLRRCDGRE